MLEQQSLGIPGLEKAPGGGVLGLPVTEQDWPSLFTPKYLRDWPVFKHGPFCSLATKDKDFTAWFPIPAIPSTGLTSFVYLKLKSGRHYSVVNGDRVDPLIGTHVLYRSSTQSTKCYFLSREKSKNLWCQYQYSRRWCKLGLLSYFLEKPT